MLRMEYKRYARKDDADAFSRKPFSAFFVFDFRIRYTYDCEF